MVKLHSHAPRNLDVEHVQLRRRPFARLPTLQPMTHTQAAHCSAGNPSAGLRAQPGCRGHSEPPTLQCVRACRVWPWPGVTSCAVGCGRRPHFKPPTIGALDAHARSSCQFVIVSLEAISSPLASQRCSLQWKGVFAWRLLVLAGQSFEVSQRFWLISSCAIYLLLAEFGQREQHTTTGSTITQQ